MGFTHGDINGVGPELIAKVLSAPEMLEICTPIIFSDAMCFGKTLESVQLDNPIGPEIIDHPSEAKDGRVNLLNVCKSTPVIEWGQQTEAALHAEACSLNAAVEAFKHHDIDVLVSAPGNLDNDVDSHSMSDFIRQALSSEGSDFDWIINGSLRTLKLHAIQTSTELGEGFAIEAFKNDLKAIYQQLRADLCEIRPRVAVLSGNQKLTRDLTDLQEEGFTIFGPFDAQSFIEAGNLPHYDAVLFLNEEEARHRLIDSLDATQTYGYVSGMPLILTYPMTGISYNIAGKDQADETAIRLALYAAIDTFRHRESYAYATRRPLEKQWVPKGRDDFKLDLTKEE